MALGIVGVLLAQLGLLEARLQNVQFGPLDPELTNPANYWYQLENPVPETYCANPRFPVVPSEGPLPMKILEELYPNGTAKPTGIWQKNLWGFDYDDFQIATQWGAVHPYPYEVQPRDGSLTVLYAGHPVGESPHDQNSRMIFGLSTPGPIPPRNPPIYNASYGYLTMSEAFDIGVLIYDSTPKVKKISELSAQVSYVDKSGKEKAVLYITKGSPFINIEFKNAMFGFGAKWQGLAPIIYINGKPGNQRITAQDFHIEVAVGPHPQGQYWHAFFDTAITLNFPRIPMAAINVTVPYTGFMQLAVGEVGDKMGPLLKQYNGVFVVDSSVSYAVDEATNEAIVNFNFETKRRAGVTADLLMLAIPHQQKIAQGAKMINTSFWCVKGPMKAIVGSKWSLKYKLTTAGFGDDLKVPSDKEDVVMQQLEFDFALLRNGCPNDNISGDGLPGYQTTELYAYVRDLGKYSDLAIAAEALGRRDIAVNISSLILKCFSYVLEKTVQPPQKCPPPVNNTFPPVCLKSEVNLYYDSKFGGIISGWYTRFAEHYCQCDKGGIHSCEGLNYCDNVDGFTALGNYGNQVYNDHHFQYGYVVKTLAWLIYFQAQKGADLGLSNSQLNDLRKQALLFARDYANPDPEKDKFFTFLRHKDIFDGHSWAEGYDYSGRVLNWVNQQSGGEAVNSYYALYLLGLAINDSNVRDWGRIQLATEMKSLQTYTHVSNATEESYNIPYKGIVNNTKCVSILQGNGANGATYYGPNAIFECGIVVLPFTPITKEFIDPNWALEAHQFMEWRKQTGGICVFPDPINNATNPCPGLNPVTWWGNEYGCCPTDLGYPENQWRSYPDWFPIQYLILGYNDSTTAWKKLQTPDLRKPTPDLVFPYVNQAGNIVGYMLGISRTQALFLLASQGF